MFKIFVYLFAVVSCPAMASSYVSLKGGTFMMGSPESEAGRFENESRYVATVADFEIGTTEVTQHEWVAVMGANPSYFQTENFCPDSHGSGICPGLPVESVSWEDVQTFIARFNQQVNDGYSYRLPSEVEWEYAARAGVQAPYHFGSNAAELVSYEWYYKNSNDDRYYRQPREVGTKLPNRWGLYDMLGNVAEWVQDDSSEGAVVRGGAWAFAAENSRSAYRGADDKTHRSLTQGFRLVRVRKNLIQNVGVAAADGRN